MSQDTDITEVSDHRQLTIDLPPAADPHIQILKGDPSDEEVAALAAVLAGAGGGHVEPGPQEFNPWGHPVGKLRYDVTSWQRVTLLERTHMRR
ncbi:acyl-CoA carboxylase epsilon subunit [Mycolicibacterium litorale]|uniref:acyl-CoA carboxylase epsilon subunit n=1 Tax=Mycolicibacterium litorale TaxID=758802 RepID=UPI003CEC454D